MRKNYLALFFLPLALAIFAACASTPPTTQVVKETVIVPIIQTQIVEKIVTATPPPNTPPPPQIVFADAKSDTNFQAYFQQVAIPAIQAATGIKVKYVTPSSDTKLFEEIRAGNIAGATYDLVFPKSMPALVLSGVPLEKLDTTKVPNLAKNDPEDLRSFEGVELHGTGAVFWRSSYALIYDSAKISNPPKSWQELYARRAEFKGHIGLISPNANSDASWRQRYMFLHGFLGSKMAIPVNQLVQLPEWQDAWAKLIDFTSYSQLPLATSPAKIFSNFRSGDTWISHYALDFSMWSARQGALPPTVKAIFPVEGADIIDPGYMAIPANISDDHKRAAYQVLNYLLGDDSQVRLISTMFQYYDTDLDPDLVPPIVWENIPKLDDLRQTAVPRVELRKDISDYIQAHANELGK